ncbi:MAG: hypothetical protein B6243_10440 [Anaerolineaceae bacterium 4572_5.2]|nr:MAG: hypothetical protein B6243_10440 [Anaerolineaceae bacterium 4572_5.2]
MITVNMPSSIAYQQELQRQAHQNTLRELQHQAHRNTFLELQRQARQNKLQERYSVRLRYKSLFSKLALLLADMLIQFGRQLKKHYQLA